MLTLRHSIAFVALTVLFVGCGGSKDGGMVCPNPNDPVMPLNVGACDTEENIAVYDSLANECTSGVDVAANISGACVRGSCIAEGLDVIADNTESNRQALATCVEVCTATMAALSNECMNCYGEAVACGAAFCATECSNDIASDPCTECRIDNGCSPDFYTCAGLTADN